MDRAFRISSPGRRGVAGALLALFPLIIHFSISSDRLPTRRGVFF